LLHVDKVLAHFNCAILIYKLPGEKVCYVFTTTSEAHVFLGNYNCCNVISIEGWVGLNYRLKRAPRGSCC